jgi:peptidyl-prolyl cis-trans isomerase A (cyclophilin A)
MIVRVHHGHGLAACIVSAFALAGCGGGGSGDAAAPASDSATIAAATAGSPKYGQSLALTVTGTQLDQGLQVAATGCDGVALDAGASGATSATYRCTVSAVGNGHFTLTRTSDGATLATVAFTVPQPQVTLGYDNGAGVSGSIVLTLAADKAPVTAGNFLAYVNGGFYVGTVFHRISPGFVIQGGGYASPLDAGDQTLKPTRAPIALEVGKGLGNTQWTIAMARTSDPDSATSQFFINLADNSAVLDPGLTAGYAVFGSVTGPTAAVAAIAGAPCAVIPGFLPSGDCTPTPNVVVTAAVQTQ